MNDLAELVSDSNDEIVTGREKARPVAGALLASVSGLETENPQSVHMQRLDQLRIQQNGLSLVFRPAVK